MAINVQKGWSVECAVRTAQLQTGKLCQPYGNISYVSKYPAQVAQYRASIRKDKLM